jgi:hypothetical protein
VKEKKMTDITKLPARTEILSGLPVDIGAGERPSIAYLRRKAVISAATRIKSILTLVKTVATCLNDGAGPLDFALLGEIRVWLQLALTAVDEALLTAPRIDTGEGADR